VPTGYSYMSEFTPHAVRGRFQSIIALLINGALPIFTVLAWLVLPHLSSDVSWRLLFGISIIALPLALAPQTMLPESPRWLMSVGRSAEADAILTRIEDGYAKRGVVLPPPMILPPPLRDLGWSALIASGVRSRTALAIAFQILQLSSIYVLNNWLPTLFVKRGYDAATTFGFAALTFAGQILGPAVGVLISDRFERRWLLAGAALIGAVMAMIYAHQTTHLAIIATGLTLTTCITFISAVGFGSYLPELWPTGIRLRGMGVAALAGRLASSLTPFAVEAALGVARDPFMIIAGIGVMYGLLALLFALLGPNTRGRSLETIEHQVAKDSRLG
jgi:putative MFS transporter